MIENWSYYQANASGEVSIPAPCNPGLSLTKDGQLSDTNGNGVADVGETINYTFTASNTGNTQLTNVTVNDPKVGATTPVSQNIPALASRTFTATYTVKQSDIDAGVVHNSATATGTPPTGPALTTPPAVKDFPTATPTPS